MIFQKIFFKHLSFKIAEEFLNFFIVFTFIQAFAEIPYNIFLNNAIECRTGRKVSLLVTECTEIFNYRKTLWCLSDRSEIPSFFSEVPDEARSLQKMGFSSQFFFMNTLVIIGSIMELYSIEFWINKSYHPFRDITLIPLVASGKIFFFLNLLFKIIL
jgi:hypothetical protein